MGLLGDHAGQRAGKGGAEDLEAAHENDIESEKQILIEKSQAGHSVFKDDRHGQPII